MFMIGPKKYKKITTNIMINPTFNIYKRKLETRLIQIFITKPPIKIS